MLARWALAPDRLSPSPASMREMPCSDEGRTGQLGGRNGHTSPSDAHAVAVPALPLAVSALHDGRRSVHADAANNAKDSARLPSFDAKFPCKAKPFVPEFRSVVVQGSSCGLRHRNTTEKDTPCPSNNCWI
jgi:hypothetical protein